MLECNALCWTLVLQLLMGKVGRRSEDRENVALLGMDEVGNREPWKGLPNRKSL